MKYSGTWQELSISISVSPTHTQEATEQLSLYLKLIWKKMSAPWENCRNKNHEEMRSFHSPTLPSNETAFQDLWQCSKIFVLLQSLPRDRALHIYIKLCGAERYSCWNLYTGGRKRPTHLKIKNVGGC